jgi:hypothetical protein
MSNAFGTCHILCSWPSYGSKVMIQNDMAYRKWILHVVECNSTLQCICSHFSCTAELHSAACRMHSAHAIFYVHNPPMAQKLWFRMIWHTENESYMLWNVIQHHNVFVAILIALPNCIRWHVECIRHMPYSMFITLLWFKYCDSEWYGTQKMNFTCCGMGFNNAMYL